MGEIFSYALASSLPLAVMYLIYKWILAGENQHGCNRVLLWCIYVVSLSLPALVPSFSSLYDGESLTAGEAAVELLAPSVEFGGVSGIPTAYRVMLAVYLAGVIAAAVATGFTVWRLFSVISRGERRRVGRYLVVLTDSDRIAPFSWCCFIVMNRRDYSESGDIILLHEMKHLEGRHWIDLLVAQLVVIFQWLNPAAWLMREELKTVHEYQADEAVLHSGANARQYQMLLIKKAVGARFPSLANSLNHSKLKKRITMMYSKKSSLRRRMRALALVPAAAVAVAVANIPAVATVISDAAEASLTAGKVTENLSTGQELQPVTVVGYAEGEKNVELPKNGVEYYVNGEKVEPGVVKAISPSHIARIDVDKERNCVRITLKNEGDTPVESASGHPTEIKIVNVAAKEKAVEKKVTDTPADKLVAEPQAAAEVMPRYKGGEAEMMKFLAMNIRYPEAAMKAGKQGYVVVKFVVSKSGKVESPEIVRSVSPELDAEALRVVGMMPDFTPGTVDGKPVDCTYTLPVSFKLQGDPAPAAK